ncbi:MAG: zinc-binding dehydrogenase, partial [Bacteroidetes bacterium]|nr:zinc-binding dehydrogenase [Bacteroidota bacterium]
TERDVLLITGIGGGVSSMALRMALTAGCKVFVTSGQDEKINRSQQEGALDGANYQSADWVAQLKKKSEQLAGISVVLDGAGGENIAGLIDLLKPGGRLVTYGATCGNPNSMDLRKIFWKQLTIAGSTMGSMSDFQSMMEFVSMHKITPEVDRVFTLKDTREAFERMKAGAQFGKIVVTP